jgi:PAS domain S-box-containing protein
MRLRNLLRRAPTIRQWLAMLLAACLLPAAVAVIALFFHSYQRERAGIERVNLDVSRALMQAIDRELASAKAAMQALATSPNLDRADLRAFYAQAADVLHDRPGNNLLLASRDGRQVVNTHVPYGTPLPHHGNPRQLQRVVASGRPLVSDLYVGPTVGRLLISVDVPVLRHGQVRYVLSMQYFGERLGAILERQHIPPDTTVTIYDSAARILWRSRGSHDDVGDRAGGALAAALQREPEGIVDDRVPGDVPTVTVFSRSAVSRWTVAIALRRSTLNAALWRSLAWIGLGSLGFFALGLALVRAIGAQIESAIRNLVAPAIALGYGEPVALPALHLREARDVGQALVQASALLRERTSQRDAAERARLQLSEASQEVERSEAFLRGIFEETPDGVLLVDPDGRVTRANAQGEELFGYPQGALAGVPIDDLLAETGPAPRPVSEHVREARQRFSIAGKAQLQGRRPDGSSFPADIMANPLHERALVILTVRDMTDSRAQEEALRRTLGDKNMLLKELYHRVKNNLQLIVSMFNLQIRALSDSGARQALLEAAGRVRTMALVHERLYQSPTLSSIALDAYVAELCEQLAIAASAPQRGIAVQVEAAPVEIGLDLAVPLGLLLNELMSNSLKHGFPEGRHGHILVRLAREGGERMRLSVSDDGVGLPPGFDRTSSRTLGLKLVSALSDQLRADFTFASSAGTGGVSADVVFTIPAAEHPARPLDAVAN